MYLSFVPSVMNDSSDSLESADSPESIPTQGEVCSARGTDADPDRIMLAQRETSSVSLRAS